MATTDKKNDRPGKPNSVNDDYHQRNAPGNKPDPSAKRNIGLGGETERNDQKDRLENLHIQGNEVTGYGDNHPDSNESSNQGPGFASEGSHQGVSGEGGNGIRSSEQPLGAKETEPGDEPGSRI
ncbi:hypothetical protein [Rufibacter soli]|jgi:hypothetical protein